MASQLGNSASMTTSVCATLARQAGFRYFSTQNGALCFGTNDLVKAKVGPAGSMR